MPVHFVPTQHWAGPIIMAIVTKFGERPRFAEALATVPVIGAQAEALHRVEPGERVTGADHNVETVGCGALNGSMFPFPSVLATANHKVGYETTTGEIGPGSLQAEHFKSVRCVLGVGHWSGERFAWVLAIPRRGSRLSCPEPDSVALLRAIRPGGGEQRLKRRGLALARSDE